MLEYGHDDIIETPKKSITTNGNRACSTHDGGPPLCTDIA